MRRSLLVLSAAAALGLAALPATADVHQLGTVNVAAGHYTHVRWSHFDGEVANLRFIPVNDTISCDHIDVTYYDVTIDLKKLADAPDLSDVQRATIEAAIPKLESAGYSGTNEQIGIDAQGYIRSVDATTSFADGSTWVRHSVLYNFGCAPKVSMPNEPPAPPTTTPCVPPPTTTTTAPPSSTTTAAPSTSTTSTTTSTTGPPGPTTPTTSSPTTTTP